MKNYYDYVSSQYLTINLKKINKEFGGEAYKKLVSFLFIERETVKFRRSMKGYLNTSSNPPLTKIVYDKPANETLHLPTEAIVNVDGINVTLRKKDDTDNYKVWWYIIDINSTIEIKVDKKAINEINKFIEQLRIDNKTKQFDL